MSVLLKKVLTKNLMIKLQDTYEDNELMIQEIKNILLTKKCDKLEIMLFDLIDENTDIEDYMKLPRSFIID